MSNRPGPSPRRKKINAEDAEVQRAAEKEAMERVLSYLFSSFELKHVIR